MVVSYVEHKTRVSTGAGLGDSTAVLLMTNLAMTTTTTDSICTVCDRDDKVK